MMNTLPIAGTADQAVPAASGINRVINSKLCTLTGGISPIALELAYEDWLLHLAISQDERLILAKEASDLCTKFISNFLLSSSTQYVSEDSAKQDKRFAHPSWSAMPFAMLAQSFLMTQQWWDTAVQIVPGVSKHHKDMVRFTIRQLLDVNNPANFVLTNPEVLKLTYECSGKNLVAGFFNLLDRMNRTQNNLPPRGSENFVVGQHLANTPGKVVYRNRLIELIQYAPSTEQVQAEPVLIVSAWIMKYYILDLSPKNSLIKYLVDNGHTVFAISWLNPESEDRDLGIEDYLDLGIMQALKAINIIIPEQKVNGVGYCLGGTLLAIAAASLVGDQNERFSSLSFFTTQVDFTEPGELSLFIDESQISFLEDVMWEKGYLDIKHMNGAFQLLNSTDLLWSRIVKNYLKGENQELTDMAAWNADGTRLPFTMHSEYLRKLFLSNDLASGRFRVKGVPIALTNIHCPIFCIATEKDHIAPWKSVYKMNLLTDAEMTFLLTSGGHNAGIVTPPGVPDRSFHMLSRVEGGDYIDPEQWLIDAPYYEGSWWPAWENWLNQKSGGLRPLPAMGMPGRGHRPLVDAPGTYVMKR
jgi:polyhydroxyalkanoate synthase